MKSVLLLGGPKCGQIVHADRPQGLLRHTVDGRVHVYRADKIVEPSSIVFVGVYSGTKHDEAIKLYKRHRS